MTYGSKERFASYWYQINEVLKLGRERLLEVGIGEGVVSRYLAQKMKMVTLDINLTVNPNVLGTVEALPFKTNSFDIILVAEVLEHLPFKKFKMALNEIRRATKEYVILTLPHVGIDIFCNLRLSKIKLSAKTKKRIPYNRFILKLVNLLFKTNLSDNFRFEIEGNREHYWEIGRKGYELKKIENEIINSNFKILNSFLPEENMYHN